MLLFVSGTVFAGRNKIEPGDTLSIWVKGESDLSVKRIVGQDGGIEMPLIGSIGVSGLSATGASKVIAELLEDGYIRDPLVQVTIKKSKRSSQTVYSKPLLRTPVANQYLRGRDTNSLPGYKKTPVRVKVVDSETGMGIKDVALFLNNKIYQSNRLGQIDLKSISGKAVVIADGYRIIDSNLEDLITNSNKIVMKKVKLADSITFHVIDAYSKQPVRGVLITLDNMKVKTNKKGTFNIKLIKREFGEILLEKRGYKSQRQIVDFKGPTNQLIFLMRNLK